MPAETHVSGKETTVKAHPHKVPPGPRVNPLSFLSSLLFGSPPDLLGLYTGAARDFGDVVRFPGGPGWTDPDVRGSTSAQVHANDYR